MTTINEYEFPCLEFKQGKTTLYTFSANSNVLWSFLKINRRQEDKNEGYQRALSLSRVKTIAKYIDDGNTIPNSIVISLENAKYHNHIIKIPKVDDAGWVIDGQHRLAGAHEAKNPIELNVIAFIGIDEDDQIGQFVTINKEAKGVPSSLYIDLLPFLKNKKPTDLAKERSADLATLLKRDEDSPFYNRIVVTTFPTKGELSLTNFVRKVTPLIMDGKGILSAYNVNTQKAVIFNYYLALKNVFPKEFKKVDSVFFQTLGFGALINALPTVFSIGLTHHQGFTLENVISIFQKIDYFNFEDWKKLGTGNAAEIQAGEDLRAELVSAFEENKGEDVLKV